MPQRSPSATVCSATASGATIRQRGASGASPIPSTATRAHSSCWKVFPSPASSKIAARPLRIAQRVTSRWKGKSAGGRRGAARRGQVKGRELLQARPPRPRQLVQRVGRRLVAALGTVGGDGGLLLLLLRGLVLG